MAIIDEQFIGIILTFLAAFAWGFAAALNKFILKPEHSLIVTMTIRGVFAVPFLAILTFFINRFESVEVLFYPKIFPILILSILFVGIGDLSFFGSLQRIDVSKTQPIAGIYPLFTAILLVLSGLEDVTIDVLIGTIVLVVGIGLLAQQTSSTSSLNSTIQKEREIKVGFILAILAAIFWSLAIFTLKIILDHPEIDVFTMATIRFAILTFFFLILWISNTLYRQQTGVKDPSFISIMDKKILTGLGVGGIISWGIGGVSFFFAIEMIGAARATPISSINPLISVIIGVLFLKERLTPVQVFGILLITLGSIIISIQ